LLKRMKRRHPGGITFVGLYQTLRSAKKTSHAQRAEAYASSNRRRGKRNQKKTAEASGGNKRVAVNVRVQTKSHRQ